MKGACLNGWTNGGSDSCYKLFTYKLAFYKAEAVCKEKGGNLAAFHSQQQYDIILKMTKYAPLNYLVTF